MSERLEDLDPTPPGGPSAMARAHANGMRKTVAVLKNKLKEPENAEALIKLGLVSYLKEWSAVYGEGTQVLGLTTTERTVMVIRQDTIEQALRELNNP